MSTPPSRYVQPDVREPRIERLWQGLSPRLEARPSRAWRWVVLGTALSAAAAGGVFWLKMPSSRTPAFGASEHAVLADAKLETKSDELSVTLGDGSSVKLGSQSQVQVQGGRSSSISLQLARGELSCDVTHREERKFKVVAGDVEVRVVGTQFSVKTSAGPNPRVEVRVARGVVEVLSARRPGVVARVAAGQSWIQDAELALAKPPSAAGSVPSSASGSDLSSNELSSNELSSNEPSKRDAPLPSAAPVVPSGRELFEKAGESRRAGDAASAAHGYEELLRLHPSDGRASLAAFELGRLRMDRLGDLPGAIVALERAVAMNIGPSFREDALARLVSVYASQGNLAACKRARDRYSSSYPAGVHAAAVATRCGSE